MNYVFFTFLLKKTGDRKRQKILYIYVTENGGLKNTTFATQ